LNSFLLLFSRGKERRVNTTHERMEAAYLARYVLEVESGRCAGRLPALFSRRGEHLRLLHARAELRARRLARATALDGRRALGDL
jgi:hypothetical protein